MRRIVEDAERDVVAPLERERERLEALARALLEHESLAGDQARAVAGLGAPDGRPPDSSGSHLPAMHSSPQPRTPT